MGRFHRTLQDAKKSLDKGDIATFYRIVQEHCDAHIDALSGKILHRLHKHIELYNTSLAWITATHGDIDKLTAMKKLSTAISALEQIKKDIKELVKKEHIKLK